MKQIVVEITRTRAFERAIEKRLGFFEAFSCPCGHFGGKLEAFTRITVDQGFLRRNFRRAAMVGRRRIEIRKARVHKRIYQLLSFLDIVAAFFELRQAHQAETQLREIVIGSNIRHGSPLPKCICATPKRMHRRNGCIYDAPLRCALYHGAPV